MAVAILTGLADAKETFYSGLKSEAEVEKETGQVLGTAKFADADWDKEFLAVESTDVVAFPVEKQFTKLEGRRVELFIKMGLDVGIALGVDQSAIESGVASKGVVAAAASFFWGTRAEV